MLFLPHPATQISLGVITNRVTVRRMAPTLMSRNSSIVFHTGLIIMGLENSSSSSAKLVRLRMLTGISSSVNLRYTAGVLDAMEKGVLRVKHTSLRESVILEIDLRLLSSSIFCVQELVTLNRIRNRI